MKKNMKLFVTVGIMSIIMGITAYAGEWKQDSSGWKYQNAGSTFSIGGWQWIDGNNDGIAECYYFDNQGYCLINTVTPDGYLVDSNGAWCVSGQVQSAPNRNVFTRDMAMEVVMAHSGYSGWWSIEDDKGDGKVVMWQTWPTGFKGKYTIYMNTGDCYEEGPYWGIDDPLEGCLEKSYCLNVKDYL